MISISIQRNALPEAAWAIIDHRISVDSSVKQLQQQLRDVIQPFAKKNHLSFEAFGQDVIKANADDDHKKCPKLGHANLTVAYNSALEPAPVSPHDISSDAWRLFSGAIKSTYASRENAPDDEKNVLMAPAVSLGNTDTRRFWDLTRNIYRFNYLSKWTTYCGFVHALHDTRTHRMIYLLDHLADNDTASEFNTEKVQISSRLS